MGSSGKREYLIFDREKALSLVDGDMEFFVEVTKLFLKSSKKFTSDIYDAIACGNSKSLERAANKLKGSVSYFAANFAFMAAS